MVRRLEAMVSKRVMQTLQTLEQVVSEKETVSYVKGSTNWKIAQTLEARAMMNVSSLPGANTSVSIALSLITEHIIVQRRTLARTVVKDIHSCYTPHLKTVLV